MRIIFLLVLPILLFGSKILSYNIYERSNHVDVMITFDTPFDGKLSQVKKDNKIILKLQSASIESPKIKTVNTSFLHKMTITPINSHTEIILHTTSGINMSASKTSDSYGLRLRFTKAVSKNKTENTQEDIFLQTKKVPDFNQSYYVVTAILIFAIAIMFWFKKKMGSPEAKSKQPWLFKGMGKKEDISVRFQKHIDTKNRIVMLDYNGNSYLVVIGSSNILLDKYNADGISTEGEFDELLAKNKANLDSYLQLDKSTESLQAYKEKASAQMN